MSPRTSRRGKPSQVDSPPSRVALPEVHPQVAWPPFDPHESLDGCRPSLETPHSLLFSGIGAPRTFHLPRWQRGQVWTPEQQVAFAETVWAGLPFQPVLLWEQDAPGGARRLIVLDGQQRLSAMGAHLIQ